MGRGILLGNDDKKEIARQAAENILKETEEQDEAQALTDSVLSEDQLDKQAKQAEIDIFDDVLAPRISKGIFVRVTVDKNGERILTNNTAPDWTWDKVQKKYGAGLYKVTLKDQQGKYITSQSKTIGESMSEEKEEKANQSTDSLLHYFSEQNKINEEKAKREQLAQEQRLEKMLSEIKETQKKSSEGLVKIVETLAPTLLPLLLNKKDNNNEMVTLLMQNMQRSEEKTMALIEKMNDKTERMIEKLTDKMAEKKEDTGPSPIEVMEKMMKARSDGKKEAREEMELIEEKAAQLAEQRSENTAPESFTDKAIKSFLPALPQLLSMANKQPGMTVPQMPAPRPQAPSAPKVIPRTTNPAQTAKRPNLGPSTQVPGKKVENNRPSGTMGMAPLKEKVLNLTIPIILESMGTEEKAPVCAQKCYEVLAANGMGGVRPNALFSADDFVSIAKNGGILDLAKTQNKEAIAIEWLKELHGSFSQKSS